MPFNYRSPRLRTPFGSFGFFHIFGRGRRSKKASTPQRPDQRCGECGYVWKPRGNDYSIRCPRCGVKFTEIQVVDAPQPSDAVGTTLVGCFAFLLMIVVAPIALMAVCGGLMFVVGTSASSKAPSATNTRPGIVAPVAASTPDKPATIAVTPVESTPVLPSEQVPPLPNPPGNPSSTFGREWSDKSGEFRTRAEFIEFRFQGSRVVLRKEDGTEISVSMNTLSDEDQAWVRSETRRRADVRRAAEASAN